MSPVIANATGNRRRAICKRFCAFLPLHLRTNRKSTDRPPLARYTHRENSSRRSRRCITSYIALYSAEFDDLCCGCAWEQPDEHVRQLALTEIQQSRPTLHTHTLSMLRALRHVRTTTSARGIDGIIGYPTPAGPLRQSPSEWMSML